MIHDPAFYAAAVAAVALVGLSKGGFGGAFALFGVPIMSLAISPVQAAAIMLPILIVMDLVALWSWRGYRDLDTLRLMLPSALLGIGVGWLLAAIVTSAHVRLVVGLLALAFALNHYFGRREIAEPRPQEPVRGAFWGFSAGFTSFVAHAGGPPFQVYALPLRLDSRVYVGTSTIFFAVLNAVKLVPYFALGQFTSENLSTSAVLLPFAAATTLVGVFIIRRVPADLFYRLSYALLVPVSLKLIWDGATALL